MDGCPPELRLHRLSDGEQDGVIQGDNNKAASASRLRSRSRSRRENGFLVHQANIYVTQVSLLGQLKITGVGPALTKQQMLLLMGLTYRDEVTALLHSNSGRGADSRVKRRAVIVNLLQVIRVLPLDVIGQSFSSRCHLVDDRSGQLPPWLVQDPLCRFRLAQRGHGGKRKRGRSERFDTVSSGRSRSVRVGTSASQG